MADTIDVFSIPFEEFMTFCNDEIDKIYSQATKENDYFAESYFEKNPDIGWIMIAHKKGNIIEQGLLSETVPTSEEIEKKSEEIGKMVFVYTKPKKIEGYLKF